MSHRAHSFAGVKKHQYSLPWTPTQELKVSDPGEEMYSDKLIKKVLQYHFCKERRRCRHPEWDKSVVAMVPLNTPGYPLARR